MQTVLRVSGDAGEDIGHPGLGVSVVEANRFAVELLMPSDMLLDDLVEYDIDVEDEDQIRELARKYGVSVQAMTHRITNLLQDLF